MSREELSTSLGSDLVMTGLHGAAPWEPLSPGSANATQQSAALSLWRRRRHGWGMQAKGRLSVHPVQQSLGAGLEVEPDILMGVRPGKGGDALYEVENRFGWSALFREHGLDDPGRFAPRKTACLQKLAAILVAARHYPLACLANAVDERLCRGIGEVEQGRGRLMRKAVGSIFAVPDADLLKILHAPQVSVLTHGAQVEAGNPERARADFGVPAIKAAKEQVGRAIGQATGLDRIEIIDQEEEDIAVRSIQRCRVAADIDMRVVDPGRPVEHAGHLPAGIACTVASDALHRLAQFVIEHAPILGAGNGTKLRPAVGVIYGLERLDMLAATGAQAILQIDGSKRRGKLA